VNCRICRTRIDPILEDVGTHPYCEPIVRARADKGEQIELKFASDPEEDPLAAELKQSLIKIIKFKDSINPRSLQSNIGPSELSSPCDRRVGYRLAQVPPVNNTLDPWPAIVGTAIHDWLEHAVKTWNLNNKLPDGSYEWITETRLDFSEFVTGRSDLLNVRTGTVVDYKGVSPDKMRTIKRDGSPANYRKQIQIYGWGYERLGYAVKKVALAYVPRAGNIKDMHVEVFDYDPSVGPLAVSRVPLVATRLVELDIFDNPHRWEQVSAVPSHDCGFCPWYSSRRTPELGASNLGCPGK